MWPTRYTSHSVVASPWLGGKGDVVKAPAGAARAHGLEFGIYLSPADLYQLRTNPKNPTGYYGNGSRKARSVIPTAPQTFQTDPTRGRTPAPGFGSYTYEVDDYNRYFLNQLYELLTAYGPISVAWFDGANPDPSVEQTYDYPAWHDLIRRLRPDATTLWKARATGDGERSTPPSLTVAMGRTRRIGGFAYLPRRDWVFEGVVDRYRFETSLDATHWTTHVESGAFGNIRYNPMLQEVTFAPTEARFFRFTALRDVEQSGWVNVAEITVLPPRPSADD
jgi:hypothetical protein